MRRGPETVLVRGKAGPRRVAVERRVIQRPVPAPIFERPFVRAEPDRTGRLAVDVENLLRGSQGRFPVAMLPTACVGEG